MSPERRADELLDLEVAGVEDRISGVLAIGRKRDGGADGTCVGWVRHPPDFVAIARHAGSTTTCRPSTRRAPRDARTRITSRWRRTAVARSTRWLCHGIPGRARERRRQGGADAERGTGGGDDSGTAAGVWPRVGLVASTLEQATHSKVVTAHSAGPLVGRSPGGRSFLCIIPRWASRVGRCAWATRCSTRRRHDAVLVGGSESGRAVTTARFWYPPRAASNGPAQVTIVSRLGPETEKSPVSPARMSGGPAAAT